MKVYTSYNQYTNGVTNNTLDKTLISNGDYVTKYLLKPIWSMTSSHEWCLVRTFFLFWHVFVYWNNNNENAKTKSQIYLVTNNLYGRAMAKNYNISKFRYIVELDLKYFENFHGMRNAYSLAP